MCGASNPPPHAVRFGTRDRGRVLGRLTTLRSARRGQVCLADLRGELGEPRVCRSGTSRADGRDVRPGTPAWDVGGGSGSGRGLRCSVKK